MLVFTKKGQDIPPQIGDTADVSHHRSWHSQLGWKADAAVSPKNNLKFGMITLW